MQDLFFWFQRSSPLYRQQCEKKWTRFIKPTIIVPIGFGVAYGLASLCGRAKAENPKNNFIYFANFLSGLARSLDEEDLINLHAKAEEFAKKQGKCADNILAYIKNVLINPEFKKNPQEFMDAWKERRGTSVEFRMPEDFAREFFDSELN